MDLDANTQPSYIDYNINEFDCSGVDQPPYGDPYPVRYKIKAVDNGPSDAVRYSVFSDFAATEGLAEGVGHEEDLGDRPVTQSSLPVKFELYQNYPNPFNPATNIQYDIPKDNFVSIKVYDILGKEVANIVNEFKVAGSYIISFDGSKLTNGIYFYRIETANFVDTKRMVLVK